MRAFRRCSQHPPKFLPRPKRQHPQRAAAPWRRLRRQHLDGCSTGAGRPSRNFREGLSGAARLRFRLVRETRTCVVFDARRCGSPCGRLSRTYMAHLSQQESVAITFDSASRPLRCRGRQCLPWRRHPRRAAICIQLLTPLLDSRILTPRIQRGGAGQLVQRLYWPPSSIR